MKGKLVILSGPSGVGKDTVIAAWAKADPRVRRVTACTTRAPREGEQDGVDYHFLTRDEFLARAAKGRFLEYKEVHGNLYATPLDDMEALLSQNLIAILKIDVQGGLEAMTKRPDAISIFLMPPSIEELEKRIRGRASDDEATIQRRLTNARQEIEMSTPYHYHVVNDDLERCVRDMMEIVK